jgi:hypothetical protein
MRRAPDAAGPGARAGRLVASLALACVGAGCALRLPPPGGAVDDQAPQILSHAPAAAETGVPPSTPVQIVFSEKMNRKSVERALRVFPNPGRIERAWRDHELLLAFEPDAPVGRLGERVVVILGSAEDRRGNRIEAPLELAYSQTDSLPRGEIAGTLSGHNRLTPTSVLLFAAPGPEPDSLEQATPLREVSPAADGAFRIGFVDAGGGAPLALFAIERVGEGAARSSDARVAFGPDTLRLDADSARAAGIELALVAPDAAGSVHGRAAGFAPPAFARLTSIADTSITSEAAVDSAGVFLLESVAPQRYRLRVHAGEDSLGVALPDVPESIRVRPGERVRLPGAPEPEPEPAPEPAPDPGGAAPPDSAGGPARWVPVKGHGGASAPAGLAAPDSARGVPADSSRAAPLEDEPEDEGEAP